METMETMFLGRRRESSAKLGLGFGDGGNIFFEWRPLLVETLARPFPQGAGNPFCHGVVFLSESTQ